MTAPSEKTELPVTNKQTAVTAATQRTDSPVSNKQTAVTAPSERTDSPVSNKQTAVTAPSERTDSPVSNKQISATAATKGAVSPAENHLRSYSPVHGVVDSPTGRWVSQMTEDTGRVSEEISQPVASATSDANKWMTHSSQNVTTENFTDVDGMPLHSVQEIAEEERATTTRAATISQDDSDRRRRWLERYERAKNESGVFDASKGNSNVNQDVGIEDVSEPGRAVTVPGEAEKMVASPEKSISQQDSDRARRWLERYERAKKESGVFKHDTSAATTSSNMELGSHTGSLANTEVRDSCASVTTSSAEFHPGQNAQQAEASSKKAFLEKYLRAKQEAEAKKLARAAQSMHPENRERSGTSERDSVA